MNAWNSLLWALFHNILALTSLIFNTLHRNNLLMSKNVSKISFSGNSRNRPRFYKLYRLYMCNRVCSWSYELSQWALLSNWTKSPFSRSQRFGHKTLIFDYRAAWSNNNDWIVNVRDSAKDFDFLQMIILSRPLSGKRRR